MREAIRNFFKRLRKHKEEHKEPEPDEPCIYVATTTQKDGKLDILDLEKVPAHHHFPTTPIKNQRIEKPSKAIHQDTSRFFKGHGRHHHKQYRRMTKTHTSREELEEL